MSSLSLIFHRRYVIRACKLNIFRQLHSRDISFFRGIYIESFHINPKILEFKIVSQKMSKIFTKILETRAQQRLLVQEKIVSIFQDH